MNRTQAGLALIVVVLVGLGLRMYRLEDYGFWYDEAFSYTMIERFSWGEMFDRLRQDVHPPFYFVTLRLWAEGLGTSLLSLRGYSVAMGCVTIVSIYLFTRDMILADARGQQETDSASAGRSAGIAAAALLAVFSAHIRWSLDAKMYALATALLGFSSWQLLRALQSSKPARWWTGYALTTAAALYTHNYALFTFVGQVAFLGGYHVYREGRPWGDRLWRSSDFRRSFLGVAGAGILYLPWIPTLLAQSNRVRADYWIDAGDIWRVPTCLHLLFFPASGMHFIAPREEVEILLAVLIILLSLLVLQRKAANWLVFFLVLTPMVCAFIVSATFTPIITPRYFLFASLFLPCCVVSVIWYLIRGRLRLLRGGIVVLLIGYLANLHVEFVKGLHIDERPGIGAAVRYIVDHRQPDQPIIVTNSGIFFSTRFYMNGAAEPRLLTPSDPLPHYLGGPILIEEDSIRSSELDALPCDEVWVLDSTGFDIIPEARTVLPDSWEAVPDSKTSFQEIFGWQGIVTVARFRRQSPSETDGS